MDQVQVLLYVVMYVVCRLRNYNQEVPLEAFFLLLKRLISFEVCFWCRCIITALTVLLIS